MDSGCSFSQEKNLLEAWVDFGKVAHSSCSEGWKGMFGKQIERDGLKGRLEGRIRKGCVERGWGVEIGREG